MKLIHQVALSDLTSRALLPPGKWKGLFMVFDGVNAAAVDFSATKMGSCRINVDGREKANFNLDKMAQLNKLDMGAIEETNATGAAFRYSCFVPLTEYFKEFAYISRVEKRIEIVNTFSTLTVAVAASGNFKLYGIPSDENLLCPYEVFYNDYDLTFGAAVTAKPEKIEYDNISRILVEADAQLTSLSLKKDGESFFDQIDKDDLNAFTALVTKTETYSASLAWYVLDLKQNGEPPTSVNDSIQLIFTVAAACTIRLLVETINLTPSKMAESQFTADLSNRAKENRKSDKGISNIVGLLT